MTELPGYLLLRAANTWQRQMRKTLKPHDLTTTQYLLLAGLKALAESSEDLASQATLARHCRTDPMMTSQVLRALEAASLIERSAHEGDGRIIVIAMTSSGAALFAKAAQDVDAADTAFYAVLGENAGPFADALRILMGDRIRRRVETTSL
ncbi:MAG: MarR family transcriptional regulator [Alphaproteobacteria bacterium]|nr:MarR family transcriptional regulator [Alphaproteobacteria bacterium]